MTKINGKALDFQPERHAPPTRAEYDAATPRAKGYLQYMFAAWPGSEVPQECPFAEGTPEHAQYCEGQRAAVLAVQDSEE